MATDGALQMQGVAVQLPTFMKASPAAWFRLCDANFFIRKVTDPETKYWYIVSKLDEETLRKIHAFLEKPLSKDPYRDIKERLCESFEPTVEQHLDALLAASTMGSEKPSNFMAELDRLASGLTIDDVKRRLYIRALPERISTAISHLSGTTGDLVKAADKSWSQAGDPAAVSEVKTWPGQGRGGREKKQFPTQGENGRRKGTICPFHAKYGEEARRCLPSCPRWRGKPRQHVFTIEEETTEEAVGQGNE